MKYRYKGSTKDNHREMVDIAWSAGLQYSWRESAGDAIARLANKGISQFVQICDSNPKFFEKL